MNKIFKSNKKFNIRIFAILLICLSQVFLFGCSNIKGNSKKETIQEETDGLDKASQDKDKIGHAYKGSLEGIEKLDSFEPSDILAVGQAFALDLLTEDYKRLESIYLYTSDMREIMSLGETKKNIIFHNMSLGQVEKIDDAYSHKYATARYVIVPIEGSLTNINIQISFNNNNEIIGFSYEEYGKNSPVETREKPDNILEEEYTFYSDGYVIPGTLTSPSGLSDYPLVIMVHGFGPSDRDLSIYANKPFQDLAWGLAEAGIASYRYDKRTYIRESIIDDTSFTVYDETINDAVTATNMAKELKEVNPNKVYILGFSQGGYLLPRIAEYLPDAAGYIFLSSPAEHMKNYIKEQYEYLAMEDGQISLSDNQIINQITEDISMLEMPFQIPDEQKVQGFHKDYWIDLYDYNPIQVARRINVPVLVQHGARDYQVTKKQYNLWYNAFFDSDNWNFHSYPELNHFMMEGEGNSYSSEYKANNYLNEQVIQDLANFILTN